MKKVKLHLDSRRRITLGKLLPEVNISSVNAYREGDKIILEPMTEVPVGESWLYENPKALSAVKKGLKEKGTHDLGSFAQYADDEL